MAEIDRKLRAIQIDLDPEREPAPRRPPPEARGTPGSPEAPNAPEAISTPGAPRLPDASRPPDAPEAPRAQAQAEPQERPPVRKGRSGPLAQLLQRSARQPPPAHRAPPAAESAAPAPERAAPAPERAAPAQPTVPTERADPRGAPAPAAPPERTMRPDSGLVSTEMHAKLLSAMRDLLDAYGWTLQQLPVAVEAGPPGEPGVVALSVGPFADTAAVRGFEQELLRIPGVSEVVLRGYEGESRAMFDVQMSEPNA